MRKFKTPVSMFMTSEQINNSNLNERLKELGYNIDNLLEMHINPNGIYFLVYTTNGYAKISTSGSINSNHINFTNVDLFIAVASMSFDDMPYYGEILKYLDGSRKPLTFKSFTSNQGIFKCFEDDSHRDYSYFRKATREEIIEHFKPKPMENKFEPKNGEIVEFSCNGIDYIKGEYIGALRKSGHIIFRLGTFTTLESGLIVAPFVREYNEPKKVTREEIAKLLGVDEFEIID